MADNGGAFAIKGFNFQKSIISLIAISNYNKSGFLLFVENKDDAELDLKDTHTFIQIKSEKLSINKLISPKKSKDSSKGNKHSILYKNLQNNHPHARYKIVTKDDFSDKEKLIKSNENIIFECPCIYKYSKEQKKLIVEKLAEQGLLESETLLKLEKSYLYFSPFKDDYKIALTFLKGVMNEAGIKVDDNKGSIALGELCELIDQKSEIIIKDESDRNLKNITSEELRTIFSTAESENLKFEALEYLKERLTFSEKVKIRKELLLIMSNYKKLKNDVSQTIGFISTEGDICDTIECLYNEIKDKFQHPKTLLYALLIDIYADRLNEM